MDYGMIQAVHGNEDGILSHSKMISTSIREMGGLYISLLLCLFASFLYYVKNIYKTSCSTSVLVPPLGRSGWPLIGETMEFISTMRKGQPEKFVMDRMVKYSAHVFQTHIIGKPTTVFCGADGNKMLFSNENKLVRICFPHSLNRIIFGSSPKATSVEEEAANLKKVHANFFKSQELHGYVRIMDELAHMHFDERWENKEQVLVHPLAKEYTLSLACRLFLSMDDPSQIARLSPEFSTITGGAFSLPINFPGMPFYKAMKASNLIRNEILSVIRQRRTDLAQGKASPTHDILSDMLSSTNDSDYLIVMKAMGLVVGGQETTTSVCTFIVKFLAEIPEIYEAVHKEQMEIAESKAPGESLNWQDLQKMKYSWNVACEVLRLVPPAAGMFRESITDFTYKGFSIRKGLKLYWSVYTTHKNPEYFPNPERFDPSRFEGSGPAPYTFVPFGGGPRMCPGKEYARLVILVFMHHLIKRFKWEKIIPDERTLFHPIPFPAKGLPVRLFPYNAS